MTSDADALAHRALLDRFLVDNDDLDALDARLAPFNLFEVLGIERAEVRHSNVLAWLLDPAGTHGLGDIVLRRFLSRLRRDHDDLGAARSGAHVELMDLSDVEVRREWRFIDVLVVHRVEKWCLLIENKIRARESRGQLARYRRAVDEEFDGFQAVSVFLTLEGDEASEDGQAQKFVAVDYAEVVDLVARLFEQRRSRVPLEAAVLLDHWIRTMRRMLMVDDEIIELCRRIYRTHREAIELIVEHGISSPVLSACGEFVARHVDIAFKPIYRGRSVWFLPKDLLEAQRAVRPGWRHLDPTVPVCWRFDVSRSKPRIKLVLEVGPIADPAFRLELIRRFHEAKLKGAERGLRDDAKYTRLWTESGTIPNDEDGEPLDDPEGIAEVAAKLWRSAGERTAGVLPVLRATKWPR